MITGQDKPDSGDVVIGPTVKIAYVDQSRDCLDGSKTVFDELAGGADILTIGKSEIPSRAYIGRFNFKGGDQQKLVGNLSGGERGRLHLAKTLMAGGNVLLLDEPSNDLDVETLRALEDALLEFAGCALIISHDRWFLDRICTHILAAEGESQWTFFAGNYQEYEEDKRKRLGEKAPSPSVSATSPSPAEQRRPMQSGPFAGGSREGPFHFSRDRPARPFGVGRVREPMKRTSDHEIHPDPLGTRFEFEGKIFSKTGPMTASAEDGSGQRLIPATRC
jgi:ABC-type multidrug transport system ATPase subunit